MPAADGAAGYIVPGGTRRPLTWHRLGGGL